MAKDTIAVIDTSALLTLFFNETGGEKVREYVLKVSMSTINISETLKVITDKTNIREEEALSFVGTVVSEIIPFNLEHALISARMYGISKKYGLSLGDRACMATGILSGKPVITADRIWAELKLDKLKVLTVR